MDTNMLGMILFVAALFLLAIVRCATAKRPPVIPDEPAAPVLVWFTLDWRDKHVILTLDTQGDNMPTWRIHEDAFDYDLLANKAAIDLVQMTTSVQEMRNWNVLVSTTGRAHNAIWDNRGTHPARLMQAALIEALRN